MDFCYAFVRALYFIAFALVICAGTAHAQYWLPDTNGLSVPVGSLATDANGYIFAGAEFADRGGGVSPTGVYRSTDHGQTWTLTPNPTNASNDVVILGPVFGVNPKGTNAAGDIFCVGGYFEYKSTDEGGSWQEFQLEPENPFDPTILAFTALPIGDHCRLFIATGSTGLYISDADGNPGSWQDDGNLSDSLNPFPTCVASTPFGAIFEAGPSEIERCIGCNGDSFDSIAGAPPLGEEIQMASNATGLIVAGGTSGLFFTLDTGLIWEPPNALPGTVLNSTYYILAVAENGDIYAGSNSTNGRQGGIVVSTDTGRMWQDISAGLTTDTINALAFDNDGALLAATDNGVFTYFPTGGVKTSANEAPASLTLEQNTPNPFTSSTSIQFSLPQAGPVSLRVFDATGREVGMITSGTYEAGTYYASFNAGGLPDGAYYYRLEAGGQTAARMFVIEH
jgi:photosystem II stability/assembly factor-like uncharacterized protein